MYMLTSESTSPCENPCFTFLNLDLLPRRFTYLLGCSLRGGSKDWSMELRCLPWLTVPNAKDFCRVVLYGVKTIFNVVGDQITIVVLRNFMNPVGY